LPSANTRCGCGRGRDRRVIGHLARGMSRPEARSPGTHRLRPGRARCCRRSKVQEAIKKAVTKAGKQDSQGAWRGSEGRRPGAAGSSQGDLARRTVGPGQRILVTGCRGCGDRLGHDQRAAKPIPRLKTSVTSMTTKLAPNRSLNSF
jgi:hypothetical protein